MFGYPSQSRSNAPGQRTREMPESDRKARIAAANVANGQFRAIRVLPTWRATPVRGWRTSASLSGNQLGIGAGWPVEPARPEAMSASRCATARRALSAAGGLKPLESELPRGFHNRGAGRRVRKACSGDTLPGAVKQLCACCGLSASTGVRPACAAAAGVVPSRPAASGLPERRG